MGVTLIGYNNVHHNKTMHEATEWCKKELREPELPMMVKGSVPYKIQRRLLTVGVNIVRLLLSIERVNRVRKERGEETELWSTKGSLAYRY